MLLEGSCHCRAVEFSLESHTPYPYMRCYCSICRKTAGGGGFAINIMGDFGTLRVKGRRHLRIYRATIDGVESNNDRHFCGRCGSALWVWCDSYPELVHPFASAIDTPLPRPKQFVDIMLASAAPWVVPYKGSAVERFDDYPDESIEGWHKARGLWTE